MKSLNCLTGDGTLLISLDPRTRVELDDPSGQVLALLELLRDGTRTPAALRGALAARWPEVSQADVDDALELLDGFGWLEDAEAPRALTAYQRERYFSNLAFFDAFTRLDVHRESFQTRLLRSHVLVLGAGGLGSSVLQNLAGLGVGRMTLVDFDRVELKNLARQFTYSEAQVGLPKVEQVAAWLHTFNSQLEVRPHNLRIDGEDDLLALLTDDVDLVVHAIDQPDDIDLIVNAACMRRGVPFIRGGLAYTQGVYWSVDPGRSACRQCLELQRAGQARGDDARLLNWPAVMRAERPNRATGPVAQMLGALVAMEALRYLSGLMPPVSGGTYHLVDFAGDCAITTDPWAAHAACELCAAARARTAAAA